MLVSVAFSSSIAYFSPMSGVTRLIVTCRPSAFFGSMLMPRKSSHCSVLIERMTSGPSCAAAHRPACPNAARTRPAGTSCARWCSPSGSRVARRRRRGVARRLVAAARRTPVVKDLDWRAGTCPAPAVPALGHDLVAAAHHLDVERRRVGGRQRDQVGRIAVEVPEEAVDRHHGRCSARRRGSCAPPTLLQALRHLVDVVDLVDRHALVHVVQRLVVEVRVRVALRAQHFLDAVVAPARPAVRGEHHLGLAGRTCTASR